MQPKHPIRLVAVDLDDTLLNQKNEISTRTAEAITAAVEQGVTVTLATGRMFCSAQVYAKQLGLNVPLITYNGALIRQALSEEELYHQPIEVSVAREILQYFREQGLYIQSYMDDKLYVEEINDQAKWYMNHANVPAYALGDKLYDLPQGPTKLLAVTKPDDVPNAIQKVQAKFGDFIGATSSKPGFVEMMDKRVSKGLALAALADKLGITAAEVMAVGDSHNDLAMIRWAGFGVAMGNAKDAVKAEAQAVTTRNDEDGVAAAIEQYVLKK